MFNNILYFIIVLLVFGVSSPKGPGESSFLYTLALFILLYFLYGAY